MALNYLLSPNFQVVSTGGKPCTGGYIEVYLAGTRDKYFCCSDFSGTLHPFKIPLDALGSNIVLADESNAYDVYIYNRYGSQLMSRYNVHPAPGGVISSTSITSTDGSITVTETANGVDLSVTDNHPDVLVCTGNAALIADGTFEVRKESGTGEALSVVSNAVHIADNDWYNYEAMVRLSWGGPVQNTVQPITVSCTGGGYQLVDFDMSELRDETVTVSGAFVSGGLLTCSVSGLPQGVTAELIKLSVFKISSRNSQSGGGSDLPDYDYRNAGQVLTVNSDGTDLEWLETQHITVDQQYNSSSTNAQSGTAVAQAIASVPTVTVDQQYNASSTNAQSGTAVAGAIGNVRQVPTTESTDNGKVLGVIDNSGTLDWVSQPTVPTTDQNYSASSTNPQSGTAVAQAIASVPTVTVDQQYNSSSTNAQSGTAVAGAIGTVRQVPTTVSSDNGKVLGVVDGSGTLDWVSQPTVPTTDQSYSASSTNPQSGTAVAQAIASVPTVTVDQSYSASSTNAQSGVAVAGALSNISQVPALTTASAGDVLTVDSTGTSFDWASPSSTSTISTLNHGENISISAGTYTWPTTAALTTCSIAPGQSFVGSMVFEDIDLSSSVNNTIGIGYYWGTSHYLYTYSRVQGSHTYVVPICARNNGSSTEYVEISLNGTLETAISGKVSICGLLFG